MAIMRMQLHGSAPGSEFTSIRQMMASGPTSAYSPGHGSLFFKGN
jgi:hypothetical protein